MKIYGLTGGIASGKSMAAKFFEELGATVIDADQVARDVMSQGQPTYEQVVAEFGTGILDDNGDIHRSKLRELIFTDPEAKEKLDNITHPPIIGNIIGRIREHFEQSQTPLIIEAALMVETRQSFPLEGLIVVYCSEKNQIKRICERDGVAEESAKAALASQMRMKEKIGYADYVIRNNGSLENLRKQVEKLWKKLSE